MRNLGIVVVAVAGVALVLCDFVKGEPVRGGYGDSLQNLGGYGGGGGGGYGGGGDSGYGHEPANYDFQYEVFGGGNFFGHEESRRDQTAKGKYHVLLPDGRRQTVNYIADESGYHPVISYEQIANPFEGPSGGYGGPSGNSGSGGYGGPSSGGSSGGYGTPISDNSLGGYSSPNQGGGGGYGSRNKRQFLLANSPVIQVDQSSDQDDHVRVYKSERNPEKKYRNRRRRFSPKKTYIIVYPDLPKSS